MDNVLMTILGIFIAAILIFVFPLMTVTERNDSIAQSVVQTATVEFVDKISISGAIKPKDYEDYIQKLESTSNTFDVEIEIQHLDENFGKKNGTTSKDLIGENERYSTFTTEILENMYLSDGTSQSYLLKKGDNVIVTAKNTNKTMAQTLKAYVYKITGKGTYEIIASSSSMVINNGGKVVLGDMDYNEVKYTIGQPITLEGEDFFVIGEDSDTVILLAKYNLNEAGTAQDTEGNVNPCKFSTTPYWTGKDADLSDNDNVDGAMAIAKAYGVTVSGKEGRLMTSGEAEPLSKSTDANIIKMLYGTYSEGAFLRYWLGSASIAGDVWFVYGDSGSLSTIGFDYVDTFGVRPVIEISKSAIQ